MVKLLPFPLNRSGHIGLSASLLHLVESLSMVWVWYLLFHRAHFLLELLKFVLKFLFFQTGLQKSKKKLSNTTV